jgi:nicotinamide-nucleotide amidase
LVLERLEQRGWRLASAESCTGGALSALLTDVEGLSHVFERGFAVYSDEAKMECLGVDPDVIHSKGAVSAEVAAAMAQGALLHSHADIAVAITGYAGPAGPGTEEGLVFIHVAARHGGTTEHKHHFGTVGRSRVRAKAVKSALDLLFQLGGEA